MSSVEILLHTVCPSIQYRLRKEIYGHSPLSSEMIALQNLILQDEAVIKLTNVQETDGWLVWAFHGYFHKWGAYTGLALEKDWRGSKRRINDLTF